MSTTDNAGSLFRLSDTSLTVADPADDVRGRKVVDNNGDDIGKVEDLLIDDQENKVGTAQTSVDSVR